MEDFCVDILLTVTCSMTPLHMKRDAGTEQRSQRRESSSVGWRHFDGDRRSVYDDNRKKKETGALHLERYVPRIIKQIGTRDRDVVDLNDVEMRRTKLPSFCNCT